MAICTNPDVARHVFTDHNHHGLDSQSTIPVEVRAFLAVNAVEPVVVTDPENPLAILINRVHEIHCQAFRIAGLMAEGFKYRLPFGKVVWSHRVQAHPDVAFTIFKQGNHLIFCRAVGVPRFVPVTDESPAFPVELEQSSAGRAKP